MPLSKHYGGEGEKVMRSMMKTYHNKETANRVFYATENKRKKKGLKEHTAEMAKKGHLRMK